MAHALSGKSKHQFEHNVLYDGVIFCSLIPVYGDKFFSAIEVIELL